MMKEKNIQDYWLSGGLRVAGKAFGIEAWPMWLNKGLFACYRDLAEENPSPEMQRNPHPSLSSWNKGVYGSKIIYEFTEYFCWWKYD